MKRNEPVSHIMSSKLITVQPNAPLSEAKALMAEHGIHHLLVTEGDRLVGILSSTDLLKVSYTWGTDGRTDDAVLDHTARLVDLMQTDPVSVSPRDSIRHATELLSKGWFHALPVVENGQKLVGIVTTTDLLQYLLEQY